MKGSTSALKTAIQLARQPALNFFELAASITALHDADPTLLREVIEKSGMRRRRLYYLLEVGKLLREQQISRAAAEEVG